MMPVDGTIFLQNTRVCMKHRGSAVLRPVVAED